MDANYTITYVEGTVTVNPATLMITASSATVAYGTAPPSITAAYSGFVNSDDATSLTTPPTCSTTATASSPVASYPSSCSGASDPNYIISYLNGTVQVATVVVTVTASSPTMTYGGSVPAITPSYSGFVNGDTAASLTTAPTCYDGGDLVQLGGTLRQLVLGRGGPELHLQLRGRFGPGQPGAAHDRGIVGVHDLRRLHPGHPAAVLGLRER